MGSLRERDCRFAINAGGLTHPTSYVHLPQPETWPQKRSPIAGNRYAFSILGGAGDEQNWNSPTGNPPPFAPSPGSLARGPGASPRPLAKGGWGARRSPKQPVRSEGKPMLLGQVRSWIPACAGITRGEVGGEGQAKGLLPLEMMGSLIGRGCRFAISAGSLTHPTSY
jgi:hypothetical protein